MLSRKKDNVFPCLPQSGGDVFSKIATFEDEIIDHAMMAGFSRNLSYLLRFQVRVNKQSFNQGALP